MVHSGCGPRTEWSGCPQRPDPHTHRRSTSYRSVWRSHLGRDRLWCSAVVTDSSTAGNGGCPVSARGTSTAQPPPTCSEACGWCPIPGGTFRIPWGPRASGEAASEGSCCRSKPRVTYSPNRPPLDLLQGHRDTDECRKGSRPPTVIGTGGSSPRAPKLVGGALCRAEPTKTRGGHGLVVKPPVQCSPVLLCVCREQLGSQAPPTLRLGALQSAR